MSEICQLLNTQDNNLLSKIDAALSDNKKLKKELLRPTKIYTKEILKINKLKLIKSFSIGANVKFSNIRFFLRIYPYFIIGYMHIHSFKSPIILELSILYILILQIMILHLAICLENQEELS